MRSGKLIILTLSLLILFQSTYSYARESVKNAYSREALLGFTRKLIADKDYYRAAMELQRLNSYFPDAISSLKYSVSYNYLLFMGKQYDELTALQCADNACQLYRFDSCIMKREYKVARELLTKWEITLDKEFKGFYLKRTIFLSLMDDDSRDTVSSIMADRAGIKDFKNILKTTMVMKEEEKSPALAFALGVIPGAGYIYSGRSGTGFVSMIVITIQTVLTVFAFRTGNYAIGYITGTIGAFFYGGSVLGGYLETVKYNESLHTRVHDYLQAELQLNRDRETVFRRMGIGF